jgi:hypothetical protein
MKYESPIIYHSKDMLKFLESRSNFQGQGLEVKNFGTNCKDIYESPINYHSKYLTYVKELADRQAKIICPGSFDIKG